MPEQESMLEYAVRNGVLKEFLDAATASDRPPPMSARIGYTLLPDIIDILKGRQDYLDDRLARRRELYRLRKGKK